MHLVAMLMAGPTYHHHGMWRHPETQNHFLDPVWWERVARTLEEGFFDAFFFADGQTFVSETLLAKGGQLSLIDPVPLVAMMARATSKIGIGLTMSTTLNAAYGLARTLASLDLLSGGRVAWKMWLLRPVIAKLRFTGSMPCLRVTSGMTWPMRCWRCACGSGTALHPTR